MHVGVSFKFFNLSEYPFYVQITLGDVGDSVKGQLYLSLYSLQANSELQMIGK